MKNSSKQNRISIILIATIAGLSLTAFAADKIMQAKGWSVHSMLRPKPAKIKPADTLGIQKAPEDAIILFDGSNLDEWRADKGGGEAKWKVENGYMQVVPKAGGLHTAKQFGNIQLHIEFATPGVVKDSSQGRGNSGVFFMGQYELQVLDSWENPTYADGQCGAIYGQQPPMVNVARKPGEWQSYDVCFMRPVFENGKVVRPARISVFHNGVCIHNNYEIKGRTNHKQQAKYNPHGEKGSISLQDHGNPMRFRNIWVRELPEEISTTEPYNEDEYKGNSH